jgi:Zn-dependent M28 family amino/carboxypeptidase
MVLTDLFDQIAANAGEVLVEAQPFDPNNHSDNAPFFNAGVPAVMFQTMGPHEYYHTPFDTIDTIDRYELEQAGRVVGATAYELAMDETFEVTRPTGFIYRHVWYILVQLSSLQVSGRWPLVTGYWPEASLRRAQSSRSKQQAASSQGPDT